MSALPAEKSARAGRILVIVGILIGFALRLFRLGGESFWYDETVSVHLAQKPLADMVAHTARDIHPPGYYALLHFWQSVTSPSLAHGLEFLYAWPSLVGGMLILVLVYALGRRLFGAQAGLIALWLAALNPFQLWYSQEVRMYTIGAGLALLSLWAALNVAGRRTPWRWLVIYIVSAAAGLYTLYYFAFWLVGVTIAMLIAITVGQRDGRGRSIAIWLAAQVGVLVLFGPWFPIAVRQVVDPPVPPWRAPWADSGAIAASLMETTGALITGQSPPASVYWPWSLATIAIMAIFAVWAFRSSSTGQRRIGAMVVLIAVIVPISLLYLISALATPVYHIRYVFLYSPLFLLMPAALLAALWHSHRWLGVVALFLLLAAEASAAIEFWAAPRNRADDHRAAVAALATNWRPGDVVLANAGWLYPILTTYWPDQEMRGVSAVQIPELMDLETLDGYTNNAGNDDFFAPGYVRTGSVDGPDRLGWGNPDSDFYSISASDTISALNNIASDAARIWHYRLYDTVSDPQGVIRSWLAENATLLAETPIPGRDLGLVQLFETFPAPSPSPDSFSGTTCFGDAVCLLDYAQIDAIEAGSPLYIQTQWSATDALPTLATSLRLYDEAGHLIAQADAPFVPQPATWHVGSSRSQALALPVRVSTKPGSYSLELVVYRQENGEALPLSPDAPSVDGQQLRLGRVEVLPSSRIPELGAPAAAFDYIDLIQAQLDRTAAKPGDSLLATFYWRPRPAGYRDTYQATLTLRDERGAAAQTWLFTLGGDSYPSGDWPPSLPVRDFYDLRLSEEVPPGIYTVSVGLQRASDGRPIPARSDLTTLDEYTVGNLEIEMLP